MAKSIEQLEEELKKAKKAEKEKFNKEIIKHFSKEIKTKNIKEIKNYKVISKDDFEFFINIKNKVTNSEYLDYKDTLEKIKNTVDKW